ncbi:MAG: alpha/beta hydrolase [Polyangiaceae bacterium]|nr:alpha/beta hydrolase [Polyangiaceae bacterium]
MLHLSIPRDVTARGVRTRILESGSGPPVLLIHGFLGNHCTFDDISPELAKSFHLVAIDLPGSGGSERPPPSRFVYSAESFAEVATDVIAALQVGRCHVIAHESGCAVAIALASEHPEFVDHMVLISPSFLPSTPPPLVRWMRTPLAGGFLFKQLLGRSLFHSLYLKHMYAPGHTVPMERINSFYDPLMEPAARESAFATLKAQLDTRPTIARLTRIKAPTLVLAGRAVHRVSPELAPRLVRQLRNARLMYTDSGHCPHEESPDAFVAATLSFLPHQ